MSRTAGHTATYVPERIAILGHVKKCEIGNFTAIGSESQGPVAYVGGSGRDAAYFVTAVNSHASNLRKVEALRDALRQMMDCAADVQMTFDQSDPSEKHEQPCCCKFCALNKAFAVAEKALDGQAEGE